MELYFCHKDEILASRERELRDTMRKERDKVRCVYR